MRGFVSVIAAVLGVLALLSPDAQAGGLAPGSSTSAAAVSIRGSIVLYSAHGGNPALVTQSGRDYYPVVAPDGRAIAFWRGSPFGSGHPIYATVMLARSNGRRGWSVSPVSQRSPPAPTQHTLVWSPDSHALAWLSGRTVQYRRLGGPQRTLVRLSPGQTFAGGLAFSGDSGTVAAPTPTKPGVPRTLRVAIRHLNAPRQHLITISFRPGVLTANHLHGSWPVGDTLAYTTSQLAPPGHTLQIETRVAGAGQQMTGLFLVADTGGQAHLVLGNGHGVHGIPPFGIGLGGATHFRDAPNGHYLATDPTGGFYVAGQIGPFHVSAPTPAGCAISQWTWLADSIHLAYVTECAIPGSSPIRFRLTLTTVSMYGGAPVELYRTVASNPEAVDLALSYRCVACG